MIQLEGVGKVYASHANDERPIVAVENVSLDVPAGELLCLIGPSGSGKTTLLKMINRLVEPDRGTVRVGDADVHTVDPIKLRRGIGYVIQSGGLLPHRTVAENVGLLGRLEGWSRDSVRDRVYELLEMVGMPPSDYAERPPRDLSGGEQQRVGIARALFLDPPIILMDEPFGALDPVTRSQIRDEFLHLKQNMRKTIVLVTHDLGEAFHLGDRVALLHRGRLLQVGTENDLRQRPTDAFVERFVSGGAEAPVHG
ncbi:MAG: ATP-binding cassette domain-containing protein [Thermoanaerobaculia bacterium]|nr:ATP-binding cassette domain-containing protein [Thermoanaerobaculia bacterium]